MSVLVVCPTARAKDYAFERYFDAYNGFTDVQKDLLMVDTSPIGDDYDEKLRNAGVPNVVRYECNMISLTYIITQVWEEVIIPFSWERDYDWVAHIESDIICEPKSLKWLVNVAETFGLGIIGHSYGVRYSPSLILDESIGCIMWKRDIFKPGDSFWDYAERFVRHIAYSHGIKGAQFTNLLEIDHLAE